MKRWSHRCATCGNPRHFLFFYLKGMIAWNLIGRWWPVKWGIRPLLWSGDYAYDHRGCQHVCGPETYYAPPDQMRAVLNAEKRNGGGCER